MLIVWQAHAANDRFQTNRFGTGTMPEQHASWSLARPAGTVFVGRSSRNVHAYGFTAVGKLGYDPAVKCVPEYGFTPA